MPTYCHGYTTNGLPCLNYLKEGTYCIHHDKEYESCPICYEDITKEKVLSCGHKFCEKCIMKYYTKNYNNERETRCPMCRSSQELDLFCDMANVIQYCNYTKKLYIDAQYKKSNESQIHLYNYYILLFTNDWILDSMGGITGSYLSVWNNLMKTESILPTKDFKKLSKLMFIIMYKKWLELGNT